MFDLEQSILEWQGKLFAAGIKSLAEGEELTAHLRDEIGQMTKSGLPEQMAFNSAVQKIGQLGLLKAEFAKANGFLGFFGRRKSPMSHRILGVLWFTGCAWSFSTVGWQFLSTHSSASSPPTNFLWMTVLAAFIY